jgi:hypothetical protein
MDGSNSLSPQQRANGRLWRLLLSFTPEEPAKLDHISRLFEADIPPDPNARFDDDETPLGYAVCKLCEPLVQLLIDKGAVEPQHDPGSRSYADIASETLTCENGSVSRNRIAALLRTRHCAATAPVQPSVSSLPPRGAHVPPVPIQLPDARLAVSAGPSASASASTDVVMATRPEQSAVPLALRRCAKRKRGSLQCCKFAGHDDNCRIVSRYSAALNNFGLMRDIVIGRTAVCQLSVRPAREYDPQCESELCIVEITGDELGEIQTEHGAVGFRKWQYRADELLFTLEKLSKCNTFKPHRQKLFVFKRRLDRLLAACEKDREAHSFNDDHTCIVCRQADKLDELVFCPTLGCTSARHRTCVAADAEDPWGGEREPKGKRKLWWCKCCTGLGAGDSPMRMADDQPSQTESRSPEATSTATELPCGRGAFMLVD